MALSVALIASAAFDGLGGLFVRHLAQYPWQPRTAWAGSQPEGSTVLLAGAPDVYAWDERVRFPSAGWTVVDVSNPSDGLTPARKIEYPFAIVPNPKLTSWRRLVEHDLPGASLEEVDGPGGSRSCWSRWCRRHGWENRRRAASVAC